MSEPLLEFLAAAVKEYRRYVQLGETGVAPVAYYDFGRDAETVDAAFRRFGGLLIDTTSTAMPGVVSGTLDTSRVAVLDGILGGAPGVLPSPVRFHERNDTVVVELESGAPLDGSAPSILTALALLASDALDQAEILGVAIDTSRGDVDRELFLTRLLSPDTIDALAPTATRIVIPVLADPADVVGTYDRSPEVRFVVRDDRVLRRPDKTARTNDLRRVVPDRDRPIVLFLGAGASASSGIALGNVYRDAALDELVGPERDEHARRYYEHLDNRDRFLFGERERSPEDLLRDTTLERVLREVFQDLQPRPKADSATIQTVLQDCDRALMRTRPGRQAMHAMLPILARSVVVTVNFDELVETDYPGDCTLFVDADTFVDAQTLVRERIAGRTDTLPILKLHGTASDSESLVANIDETEYGLAEPVRTALTELTGNNTITWVWVGCSMRDRDVNAWLGGLPAGALDEWWVDPLPGATLDEFVNERRRAQWLPIDRRLEQRLFITSADVFLSELHSHVAAL